MSWIFYSFLEDICQSHTPWSPLSSLFVLYAPYGSILCKEDSVSMRASVSFSSDSLPQDLVDAMTMPGLCRWDKPSTKRRRLMREQRRQLETFMPEVKTMVEAVIEFRKNLKKLDTMEDIKESREKDSYASCLKCVFLDLPQFCLTFCMFGNKIPKDCIVGNCWGNFSNDIKSLFLTDECEIGKGRNHFLVPPHSSFLLAELSQIHQLFLDFPEFGYQFICVDPPWPNLSVNRSKKYEVFSPNRLFSIPMVQLLDHSGAFVAIWVTNNLEYHEFIRNLLVRWNLEEIGVWYYVKVTDFGELAIPTLTSRSRRSYECVFICKFKVQLNVPLHSRSFGRFELHTPPEKFVIVATPPAMHSRKPNMFKIMEKYLPPRNCDLENESVPCIKQGRVHCLPPCLELFARNLTPHVVSFGNECILHQHEAFFVSNIV